jgi:uncharacterized phage infection (PIP) family protein YhgE
MDSIKKELKQIHSLISSLTKKYDELKLENEQLHKTQILLKQSHDETNKVVTHLKETSTQLSKGQSLILQKLDTLLQYRPPKSTVITPETSRLPIAPVQYNNTHHNESEQYEKDSSLYSYSPSEINEEIIANEQELAMNHLEVTTNDGNPDYTLQNWLPSLDSLRRFGRQ